MEPCEAARLSFGSANIVEPVRRMEPYRAAWLKLAGCGRSNLQAYWYLEALIAIRLYVQFGAERLAGASGNLRDAQRDDGLIASVFRRANGQPKLVRLSVGIDRALHRGAKHDTPLRLTPGSTLERYRACVELHSRRLRESYGIGVLLHECHTRRGGAADGVGPSIALKPAGDGPILQQTGQFLGGSLTLLGELERRLGALHHTLRKGSHGNLDAHLYRAVAAVGLDRQFANLWLGASSQLLAADVKRKL
jgi:hypothetical protein